MIYRVHSLDEIPTCLEEEMIAARVDDVHQPDSVVVVVHLTMELCMIHVLLAAGQLYYYDEDAAAAAAADD
jgi:hypothetical protein